LEDEEDGLNDSRVNKADDKVAEDNGIDEDQEPIKEEAAAEAAKSNIKIAANAAKDGGENKMGGHGLRHCMARLEAAMSVLRSTAARFAEWARASRATVEEAATEHKRVCRAIMEDQAGALDAAIGPSGPTWPCSTWRAFSR
jgi:hypothetical protein